MKNLPWIGLGLLAFLILSTQIPATADVVEQAKQYFSDDQIEQGQTFASQHRWIFWANALAQLTLMVYLAFTPLGKRLYLATGAWVHGHWFTQLLLLGGIYFVASALVGLPFRLAHYFVNVHWEMTQQPLLSWFGDYLLGLVVMAILDGVMISAFYAIMRALPELWWIAAGVGGAVFALIVAFILPVVIAPLFNTLTPIGQTEWKSLEPRLRELGKRVEITPASIYVVDASRQSNAGNAYYSGLGSSQRIVVYDTFLKNAEGDEIETVIAHEMGHWWEGHIFKGILIGGAALTIGLYGLFRYLNMLVEAGTLRAAGDPAGLFRVILLAHLAFAVTLPIQNYVSRRFEREADAIALNLSKKPLAFKAAEIRLATQNKANVAPSRFNVLLFATHPPVVERIQAADEAARR